MTGPRRCSLADGGELPGWGEPGENLVHAGHRADGLGYLGPVTRGQDDPADTAAAQRPDGDPGVRPDPVGQQQRPRGPVVDRDEHGQHPIEPGTTPDGPHPGWGARHPGPFRSAERHVLTGDGSRDPLAGLLGHVFGPVQGVAPVGGRVDDRARQHVAGHLIQGGRRAEDLRGRQPSGWDDRGDLWPPDGERAGLVQQQGPALGEAFQHSAVLDHHATACRRRQTGDQGHRCGQDERAWRGHHQNRHRASRAAEGPGGAGHGQGQWEEPQRVPVGQPDERRLRPFCLGHQADDPRVRAVFGASRRAQVERAADVQHATAHRVTGRPLNRMRLTRERGLIQHRRPAGHGAVHRKHITGRDHEQVARDDPGQRHGLQRAVAVPPGGPRCAGQQRVQVPLGPFGGPFLQRPPAGKHDGDQRGREQFTDGHRPGHGEDRDQVYPDPAAAEAAGGGPQCVAEPGRRGSQPQGVSGRPGSGQRCDRAAGQAGDCHSQQQQRRMTAHQLPAAMQDSQRHNISLPAGRGGWAGPEVSPRRAIRPRRGYHGRTSPSQASS